MRMTAGGNQGSAGIPFARFSAYVAIVGAIAVLFALSWVLRDVLLLIFGAIVVSVIIRLLALPLSERTPIGEKGAVAVVVLALVGVVVACSWWFGNQIAEQMRGLMEELPRAAAQVRSWLESTALGGYLLKQGADSSPDIPWLETIRRFASLGANTVADVILILFVGVYVAASPGLYLNGAVRLVPPGRRERVREALVDSGRALRRWFLGQLVSMVSVGVLTGLGLWMVGAPLPLALGVAAGLLEFIPVLGPILAAVPGILVALSASPQTAGYAALVYLAVQQIEGNLIMPVAQRWAVSLPEAVGLVAIVASGLLFGFLGVLFGGPLAVVMMRLVQTLYIDQGLEGGTREHERGRPGRTREGSQ